MLLMTKGIPSFRNQKVAAVTSEARRVLLKTRNWERTREHLRIWIKQQYAPAQRTVTDYIADAQARLMKEPECRELIGGVYNV